MDKQKLEALNKRKAVIKGKITKLKSFLENYEFKEESVQELSVKLQNIKALRNQVEVLQTDYCVTSEDPEQALGDVEDRIDESEVRILFLLSSADSKNETNSNQDKQKNDNIVKEKSTKINLPELSLPVFTGKYSDFAQFRTQFENLIVKNTDLTDTQRLFYLQAALKGEAKLLQTTDDTFESLFSALKERYDNKRLVVESLIQNMTNYHVITTESAKELRMLSDNVKKNLRSLKLLDFTQNDLSDILLINILTPKLDRETRKQYEISLKSKEVPKLEDFFLFLESRSIVLESLQRNVLNKTVNKSPHFINKPKSLVINSKEVEKKCILCKQNHWLFKCSSFLEMNVSERYKFVKKNSLCFLCLKGAHVISQCRSNFTTCHCGKRHNYLLHKPMDAPSPTQTVSDAEAPNEFNEPANSHVSAIDKHSQPLENEILQSFSSNVKESAQKSVLLSTAELFIEDKFGNKHMIRILLDSASSVCFLNQKCADLLQLKRSRANISVSGINGVNLSVYSKTKARISDAEGKYIRDVEFFIVPNITGVTPPVHLEIDDLKIPECIKLADRNFYRPGRIDALIGNEYFFEILKGNKFRTWDNKLLLSDSVFGYIVSGALPVSESQPSCFLSNQMDILDETVKRFFEIETVPEISKPIRSNEEIYVENHFAQTHKRQSDGRYIVKLPVKESELPKLSNTYDLARRRVEST